VSEETTVEGGSPPQTPQTGPTQAPAITKPVLIGRKLGMIQQFREDGSVVGTTVIAAERTIATGSALRALLYLDAHILVNRIKTAARNPLRLVACAIQLGFGRPKKKRLSKGALGHLKQLPPLEHLREVRLDDVAGFATGQEIGVDRFAAGDKVHVSGVSKGKGFQGPVHLHHFTRGPKSHGSDHLRRQGSVGSGTTPGRVLKGLRMASHQGADRVTVRNLQILKTDPSRALLFIAGAVPGGRNGIVMVRKA